MSKIDAHSWNAALDAAAFLIGRGYHFVRRPLDQKTMTYPVEIRKTGAQPKGDYLDWTHVTADEEGKDVAAIMSLKRPVRRQRAKS